MPHCPTETSVFQCSLFKQLNIVSVYVVGFVYPVVPKGQARIRVQISAAMTRDQMDRAVSAFRKVGKTLRVI